MKLFFYMFFVLTFLGCGQEKSVTDDANTFQHKEAVQVLIKGEVLGALSKQAMTLISDAVLSITIDVFDRSLPPQLIKTAIENVSTIQGFVQINIYLDPGLTYDLFVRAYSAIDGGGSLLYQGSYKGLLLPGGGGSASLTIPLSSIDIPLPEVQNLAASPMNFSAILSADIIPKGFETISFFEWGLNSTYGNATPITLLHQGNVITHEQTIKGLEHGKTYHYRIVVENSGNTIMHADQTFSTFPSKVTLSWNPPDPIPTDLSGYYVYSGMSSGVYVKKDSTVKTSFTLTVPSVGIHYFNVTAYDTAGNESEFAGEVSKEFW